MFTFVSLACEFDIRKGVRIRFRKCGGQHGGSVLAEIELDVKSASIDPGHRARKHGGLHGETFYARHMRGLLKLSRRSVLVIARRVFENKLQNHLERCQLGVSKRVRRLVNC